MTLGLLAPAGAGAQPAAPAVPPRAVVAAVAAEAEGGVVTNPRYAAAGDSADVVGRGRLAGRLARRGPRGTLALTAAGEVQRFRATADLARTTYGLGAEGERRVTPRLAVRGGTRAFSALTRNVAGTAVTAGVDGNTDAGVAGGVDATPVAAPAAAGAAASALPLLPLALARTLAADAGVAYRASPRTTLTADASAERTTFDVRALADGTVVRVRVGASRQLAPPGAPGPAAAGVTLTADRAVTGGQVLASRTATLDWSARLRGGAELRLRAGASVLGGGREPLAVRPAGGAALGGPLLGGRWDVRYARAAAPALGVGALLTTDQAGAGFARLMPGGLALRAGVDRAWLRVPASAQRTVTTSLDADVRRTLAAGLWVGAGGALRDRAQPGVVRSRDLVLRAGYASAW